MTITQTGRGIKAILLVLLMTASLLTVSATIDVSPADAHYAWYSHSHFGSRTGCRTGDGCGIRRPYKAWCRCYSSKNP